LTLTIVFVYTEVNNSIESDITVSESTKWLDCPNSVDCIIESKIRYLVNAKGKLDIATFELKNGT